jgi:hypothetical protein
MAGALKRSHVHVEGEDDLHAIVHLLIRHGIEYDTKPWRTNYPEGNRSRFLNCYS